MTDQNANDHGPGPRENTDDATQADMGLTGTPDRAYSPAGMPQEDREEDDADDGDEEE